MGLHEVKKLLHSKRYEMVTKLKGMPPNRVGENIFWLCIRQRIDDQNTQGVQKTKLPQNQ
jgi:hypothetical protein